MSEDILALIRVPVAARKDTRVVPWGFPELSCMDVELVSLLRIV